MKIGEVSKSTEYSKAYSKAYTNEKVKTWAQETGEVSRLPRILLTSVFGPYAQDDEFGSRKINPMELFQNQVTRAQGAFSIREFHGCWGLLMIQSNISTPCALLEFPTIESFKKELTSHHYDIVGISSIIVNVEKVKEMCRIIRQLSPHSKIVVGGHVAAIFGLEKKIETDHIVKGEGISWMRKYLREDANAPIYHPPIHRGAFGFRVMGITIPSIFLKPDATIIPSVGCPMGCNFCTTSAFFGGKGGSVVFYKTGAELFDVMLNAESALKQHVFFIMDENFLLNKPRAMELLELMKKNNKSWSLRVFASANALGQYTIDELIELGVAWVWIGLESPHSKYEKLKGADTKKLVRELQSHGILTLGSTIIGLEHHTPENIVEEVEYSISHETDFHQFSLYTPIPGTPLYAEMETQGRLLKDVDLADIHAMYKFNFKHPAISYDDSKKFLDWAFRRDFELNGPSIFRIFRTTFTGWKRYKDHPDERIRKRVQKDTLILKKVSATYLWAMEHIYKDRNKAMSEQIHQLRLEIEKEFGLIPRIAARLFGPMMVWTTLKEEERLAQGWTYEPQTFIERKNWTPE